MFSHVVFENAAVLRKIVEEARQNEATQKVWETNKSQPGIVYLMYRILMTGFVTTTWVLALRSHFYLYYFTMWCYSICGLQFLLATVLQLYAVVLTSVFGNKYAYVGIFKMWPFYWILHSIAVASGFVVTLVFWTMLWKRGTAFTAVNFFVHGSNSIILFIDLVIVGHPIRILHVVYPLVFGILYVIFNISYYYYDINRGGRGYIYRILNWGHPLEASIVVVVLLFLTIIFHLCIYLIHQCKLLVHDKMFPENTHPKDDPMESIQQM